MLDFNLIPQTEDILQLNLTQKLLLFTGPRGIILLWDWSDMGILGFASRWHLARQRPFGAPKTKSNVEKGPPFSISWKINWARQNGLWRAKDKKPGMYIIHYSPTLQVRNTGRSYTKCPGSLRIDLFEEVGRSRIRLITQCYYRLITGATTGDYNKDSQVQITFHCLTKQNKTRLHILLWAGLTVSLI